MKLKKSSKIIKIRVRDHATADLPPPCDNKKNIRRSAQGNPSKEEQVERELPGEKGRAEGGRREWSAGRERMKAAGGLGR